MGKSLKILRTCKSGHQFYKSTDCPTCPECERLKKTPQGFLSLLSNPARNTLLYHGIKTLKQLSNYSEKEVLKLHGMGIKSMPILKKALAENGLSFRKDDK